jgi:hypothetical protein
MHSVKIKNKKAVMKMSGHNPCTCGNRKNWAVIHRKHNHSHFQRPKGGEHISAYSLVYCFSEGCHGYTWTKAKYVSELPDAVWDEKECRYKKP